MGRRRSGRLLGFGASRPACVAVCRFRFFFCFTLLYIIFRMTLFYPSMKALFAADLHGKKTLYTQCDACIADEKPRILILGGDLFPEAGDIRQTPAVQQEFIDREFRPRLARYRAQGVEEILLILGNHDLSLCETSIRDLEQRGLCHYLHGREVSVRTAKGPVRFAGYSYSPPSPYRLRDFDKKDLNNEPVCESCLMPGQQCYASQGQNLVEVDSREYLSQRGTIENDLTALAGRIRPGCVFICHAPPKSQCLDCETADLHVGSKAVRNFIRAAKPRLSLHGHIHFSPGNSGKYIEQIEGVSCVQPGQKFSRFYGVFFDTDNPAGTLRHTVLGEQNLR